MKKSLKQKLALFLAIIMLFTMSLPASMLASAADADGDGIEDVIPGEGEGLPGEGEGDGEGEGEEPAPEVPADPNAIAALEGDVTSKVDVNTVVSSNEGFANEGAANLFVPVKNTKFCGNVQFPFTVTWSMTEATAVTAYAITSGGDSALYPTRDPRGWTFYGSADGAEWVELDTRAGQGFGKNGLTKVYAFENETAYTQYKLEITDAAIGMIQFAAVQLSTADLSAVDADLEAAAKAAEFDAKLAEFGELTVENAEEKAPEVEALRAEYNALDGATRNLVKNIKVLTAAEAFLLKLDLLPVLEALLADIDLKMAEGAASETGYDYHLNGMITDAYALIKDLGPVAAHLNTNALDVYRATLDAELNALASVSAGTVNNSNAKNAPWMGNLTEEELMATGAAAAAELLHQYTRQGTLLSDGYLNGVVNLTTEWGNIVLAQLEGGDNVTDPWAMGRKWSCVVAPFSGMAFSVKKYMGGTGDGQDLNILSNEFIYNGRVYQQRWGRLLSFEYGTYAEGVLPAVREETLFPGNGGTGDLTKNTFRYAYAKYNMENKDAGINAGIPAGNAVEADGVIYQAFESADGIIYIAASATAIGTADASNPTEIAHVVSGDILTAIMGEDDFATAIAKTGAPLTCVDAEGVQLFENGVATADGFEEYTAENEYLKVNILLNNLPTEVTRETLETAGLAIEQADAAVAALTANQDKVDTTALEALKAAYETLKTDVAAAEVVEELIAALPATITLEDEEAIVAAREAYEALTDDQKAIVNNFATLQTAERDYTALVNAALVQAVKDMIDALPADEEIDGENFETAAAAVEAAWDAYEALPSDIKIGVDDARYYALEQKLEIVDAEGYTNWIGQQVKPGDVDDTGVVDVADIMKLKALIMADTWTDAEEKAGDVNGSGALDVGDIMEIKAMIMAG